MSVVIKKEDSAEKIREALNRATNTKNKKSIPLDKYFGKVSFDIEGLAYQKKLRDEWE